jgi:hypothetical protein
MRSSPSIPLSGQVFLQVKFASNCGERRRLVWTGVTANPTAEWIARQITEAFPWDEAPRYLARFVVDSPLEDGGFEPLVPLTLNATNAGERDKKIAMTPLRRTGKPSAADFRLAHPLVGVNAA